MMDRISYPILGIEVNSMLQFLYDNRSEWAYIILIDRKNIRLYLRLGIRHAHWNTTQVQPPFIYLFSSHSVGFSIQHIQLIPQPLGLDLRRNQYPLLHSPPQPLLQYLDSFRYVLSEAWG